jgi:hypothetical protein
VVLRFETVPTGSPFGGTADLDNIQFSADPAPEPSTLVLLAIGALTGGAYLLRRHRDCRK